MAEGVRLDGTRSHWEVAHRIKRRQASGREWREVDVPRRAVQDQFAHRLAVRGRVELPHTLRPVAT
jgi:hypothetical protein